MKHVILILLIAATLPVSGQKTTRNTISKMRGITITQVLTETDGVTDTLFMMMGQNGKYTHITDLVIVKHGTPGDINDLLTECMKFLPEKSGTSLEYKGNTLMSIGGGQIMVFGVGRDQRDYVMLSKGVISRLQTDLQGHL